MSIWEDELHAKNERFVEYTNELFDRDTPKKPIFLTKDIVCRKCDSRLGDNDRRTQALVKFCSYCGSRIDWGEE